MTERVIEIEADSLEEAREQLNSQIPEGLHLLSETVISDGLPTRWRKAGDSVEDAIRDAHDAYLFKSGEAEIIEEKVLRHPKTDFVMVDADDEKSAEIQVWRRWDPEDYKRVVGVKLITPGSKGFLGFGKKIRQYEVEVFELAIVQITYTARAKIEARIGETWEEMKKRVLQESVGKAIDIGYGWEGLPWSSPGSSDNFSSVIPGTYVIVKVQYDLGHPWVYIAQGGLQYKVDGGDLYAKCLS